MGDNVIVVHGKSELIKAVVNCGRGDVIKVEGTTFEFRPIGTLAKMPVLTGKGEPVKSGATIASKLIGKIKRTPMSLWGGR